MADQDIAWMRRALALAEAVTNITTPNPRVGCVIVRDGVLLGAGATQAVGGPHAEVCALRDAAARGVDVRGATAYVTLEPCSHFGRTPPCCDALAAAGLGRVVAAMGDPNPLVNGRGMARLRAAGIQTVAGICEEEALALNIGFVARMSRGTPWAWLKTAASLDGRSALENGQSQWITGPQARDDGHRWRARSCVVLTGIGTVLHDNPRLNVRALETPRQPRKALIDGDFRLPEDALLIEGAPLLVFTAREDDAKAARLAQRGVQVILLPGERPGTVDLPAVMQWLAEDGVNEVHVEAGPGLNGALLRAGCIDELISYVAPVLLGDAQPMARLPALNSLAQARRFEFTDMVRLGADVRVRARVAEHWDALRAQVRLG
ncbi:bifunctional diaminohydroxyphosphoribosylaminopyrimidine deaminase/5-amino-6-(5-phosphoribosylamino)uracil reductase RibD [Kerstersia gyiorum]|jgi:diaminohydroxyphosphoribosylaminopyrimidine deaminase/5-amino-6-(5-phosphoribosylamino)uracil reductase|uniref:bifunctional diaminohydroxyphosphoribosylaminopyrimidine deaminase/5-amino-6-(5-phosphoribosylamino)uracil reductase RibD n=1 Tax=Kerstersia gyiorum TaxID=206506 RepID=UPI000FDCC58F